MSNVLGPKPEMRYLGTNSVSPKNKYADEAFEGKIRQPVHCDMIHDHLDFPFAMTVNIPFVDTSVDNGATEFWLGTHFQGNNGIKDPALDGPWIAGEYLEKRRLERPPIRPPISKGSLLIRDMRLWHAGIANETSNPRIMLSMVRPLFSSNEASFRQLVRQFNADHLPRNKQGNG